MEFMVDLSVRPDKFVSHASKLIHHAFSGRVNKIFAVTLLFCGSLGQPSNEFVKHCDNVCK